MPYKRIVVEIISQEGNCAAGLKVGDKIIFEDGEVKGKFCISAMYSVIPKIYAMKYEANFPWLKDKNKADHACPDAANPLVMRVTREDYYE